MSNKSVMVVGGGIAGLTAAWELARQNIRVELVEKRSFLGGHSIGFTCKAVDECRQCGACSVELMLANVINQPLINIHLSCEVKSINRGKTIQAVLRKSSAKGIDDHGAEKELKVDAVVLATGFSPFDPELKPGLGYGRKKNVITSMELENLLRKNSGLTRPSDGKAPERVAFIQCVGSRDQHLGNLWCSQVCCTYAMGMASVIKHKKEDTDISIFYMDIQNSAREFPIFHEKVKNEVKFKRAIPVDIYQIDNDRLSLGYMSEKTGLPMHEKFDLVVLSIGMMPGTDTVAISEKFAVDINEFGFLADSGRGVFVAGTAKGPGSIFDTIADSEKAALEAMQYLGVIK